MAHSVTKRNNPWTAAKQAANDPLLTSASDALLLQLGVNAFHSGVKTACCEDS